MINIKKNLKNNIDFISLIRLSYSWTSPIPAYPSKYRDFIKLKLVENKIIQKNKKIIFIEKSSFVSKILDLKWKIPNKQNSITFILIIAFPKIKLIGKKLKTRFVNKTELNSYLFLASSIFYFRSLIDNILLNYLIL